MTSLAKREPMHSFPSRRPAGKAFSRASGLSFAHCVAATPTERTQASGRLSWPGGPGFTLIELLIVVAIIAVLAAIAVPNLLEAQVRAKVSRARGDLRSIAAALETYRLDHNRYPTMIEPGFNGGVEPLAGSDLKWWYVPDALSTPVAYLANADLRCPFGGDLPREGDFSDDIWRRYSYENVLELETNAAQFSVLLGKYGPDAHASTRIGHWRVLCIGPDNAWNPMVQYDPSNGARSPGNVMRTQADPAGAGAEQQPAP